MLDELNSDGDAFVVVDDEDRGIIEHYIHGIAIREDIVDPDAGDPRYVDPDMGDRLFAAAPELPRNDVLIVASVPARRGDRKAWGVARRN